MQKNRDVVESALSRAVNALVLEQPDDPVRFLSRYLAAPFPSAVPAPIQEDRKDAMKAVNAATEAATKASNEGDDFSTHKWSVEDWLKALGLEKLIAACLCTDWLEKVPREHRSVAELAFVRSLGTQFQNGTCDAHDLASIMSRTSPAQASGPLVDKSLLFQLAEHCGSAAIQLVAKPSTVDELSSKVRIVFNITSL